MIEHVIGQANGAGHIPTVPGTESCVGYDPGLILMSLTQINHPEARKAYDRVVKIRDGEQVWNEYYDGTDNVRTGCCRARPWESGINAEAIIEYLLSVG
jgi:hypothetical protein